MLLGERVGVGREEKVRETLGVPLSVGCIPLGVMEGEREEVGEEYSELEPPNEGVGSALVAVGVGEGKGVREVEGQEV